MTESTTQIGLPLLAIRPGAGHDADAVQAMHNRCSEETLHLRFHAPLPGVSPLMVRQMLEPENGWSLVAVGRDRVVGLACAAPVSASAVEVGLLVEDRHQRQGIGSRLLHELAVAAADRGYQRIECRALPENGAALATLRRARLIGRVTWNDGLIHVSTPVRRMPRSDLRQPA